MAKQWSFCHHEFGPHSFLPFFFSRYRSFQLFSPLTTTSTFRKKNSSNQVTLAALFYSSLSRASSEFTLMPAQGPSGWRSFQRSRQRGWRRTTWRPSAKSPSTWCAPPSWTSPQLRATGHWGTERLAHTSTRLSSPRPPCSPTGTTQDQWSSEHGGQPVLTQQPHQPRGCSARCQRSDGRPKEECDCAVVHHRFAPVSALVLLSRSCCHSSIVFHRLLSSHPAFDSVLRVFLCFPRSTQAASGGTDCVEVKYYCRAKNPCWSL